jgi:competence protein ComFB
VPERDPTFENLENLQEEEVLTVLRRLAEEESTRRPDLCTCDRCLVDMAAVALNSLPPRYVADRFNKFPETADELARRGELVDRAVRMAINAVSRRPHH